MIDLMYIDIVDACNLSCKTCFRGQRLIKNTRHVMDFRLFSSIIEKARSESIKYIHCYNWTEPFLHPDIMRFVKKINKEGLQCCLSSNLSLKNIPNLTNILRSGVDDLIVTVSGFTQEIHSVNHSKSNIDNVFKNLEKISKIHATIPIPTTIDIHYLEFDYNKHEIDPFRRYALDLGFKFSITKGNGNPSIPDQRSWHEYEKDLASSFLVQNNKMSQRRLAFKNKLCKISSKHIAVDSHGDVFLCCAQPNLDFLKIGQFLEIDIKTIFYLINTHPICNICDTERIQMTHSDIDCLHSFLPHY